MDLIEQIKKILEKYYENEDISEITRDYRYYIERGALVRKLILLPRYYGDLEIKLEIYGPLHENSDWEMIVINNDVAVITEKGKIKKVLFELIKNLT